MTTLIQLTDKHYADLLPVGSEYLFTTADAIYYMQGGVCKEKPLPTGSWRALFLATTATEEDCKKVAEKDNNLYTDGSVIQYKDYTGTSIWDTALESFHSLLQSKQCYLANPFGNKPVCNLGCKCNEEQIFNCGYTIAEWNIAERRTGNYLILEKI